MGRTFCHVSYATPDVSLSFSFSTLFLSLTTANSHQQLTGAVFLHWSKVPENEFADEKLGMKEIYVYIIHVENSIHFVTCIYSVDYWPQLIFTSLNLNSWQFSSTLLILSVLYMFQTYMNVFNRINNLCMYAI